jgi:murein DD-endopeptidase MepM/ murein hydrolase activator NlpD
MAECCEGLVCPRCQAPLRWRLIGEETSREAVTVPVAAPPIVEIIRDQEVPSPVLSTTVKTFNVRTPVEQIPEAPTVWTLPMQFRQHNPWGWLHGQVNDRGQLHPGYDLNNGSTSQADLGEPLYAVRPGTVIYAKRSPGWGTLLAVLMDETVDGRRVCYRFGHPDTILVQWGEHVEAGQLIATCGDGKDPGRYLPHLHYDVLDVEVLWEATKGRGLGKPDLAYYAQGMNRELFARLYLDPRRFHPEIDAALRRVGK